MIETAAKEQALADALASLDSVIVAYSGGVHSAYLAYPAGRPARGGRASACLSTRIPYHSEVTDEKLRTIERAEQAVRGLGFRVFRVRHHDDLARVEIARDAMPRAIEPDTAAAIVRELKASRYTFVTLDLQGYPMGSLNEGLFLRPT